VIDIVYSPYLEEFYLYPEVIRLHTEEYDDCDFYDDGATCFDCGKQIDQGIYYTDYEIYIHADCVHQLSDDEDPDYARFLFKCVEKYHKHYVSHEYYVMLLTNFSLTVTETDEDGSNPRHISGPRVF